MSEFTDEPINTIDEDFRLVAMKRDLSIAIVVYRSERDCAMTVMSDGEPGNYAMAEEMSRLFQDVLSKEQAAINKAARQARTASN